MLAYVSMIINYIASELFYTYREYGFLLLFEIFFTAENEMCNYEKQ